MEFFRGARERQDLDRLLTDVEAALAAKFNDQRAAWPEFDLLDIIKRFPPTKCKGEETLIYTYVFYRRCSTVALLVV